MYIRDGKRFNPYADMVVGGVLYPSGTILDHPQAMVDLGVVEIPEPDKPADYSPLLYIRGGAGHCPVRRVSAEGAGRH